VPPRVMPGPVSAVRRDDLLDLSFRWDNLRGSDSQQHHARPHPQSPTTTAATIRRLPGVCGSRSRSGGVSEGA
jgi:hypothetical protein